MKAIVLTGTTMLSAALCVCATVAEEMTQVEFVAHGGVKCRLTADGSSMWRLRTAELDGSFADAGAVQSLARWMGETVKPSPNVVSLSHDPDGWTASAKDGTKAVFRESPFRLSFLSATGRLVLDVVRIETSCRSCVLGGRLLEKEAVYGLGERLDRLNKRGQCIDLYTRDGYNDKGASYVAIPLFATTRGGGVFVNAYERMKADMGASDSTEWRMEVEKGALDAYFIATDAMRDVPGRYMELSGRPAVPDDWQYGPVVCRYWPDFREFDGPFALSIGGIQTLGLGLRNIIDRYRDMGALPTAVIAEGADCNMYGTTPEETTAKRAEIVRRAQWLAKDGIKYMVYMASGSVMMRNAPGFKDEYEVRVVIEDAAGHAKSRPQRVFPSITFKSSNPDLGGGRSWSAIDITNQEAWQWYLDKVWQPLLDAGVRGAKIDFCEEMPDDGYLYGDTRIRYLWKNRSVFDGAAVHHAYPTFFITKLCRDLSARLSAKGQGRFMALSRGGGIGSQRSPFMWAGDQHRTFEKLPEQLLAMLNSGVSGIPFMTYDMAGYHYPKMKMVPCGVLDLASGSVDMSRVAAKGKDEEVVYRRDSGEYGIEEEQSIFARGAAFTAYSPCMQTHGYVRHPFEFAAATRDIYAKCAARHLAMVGEISAAARRAVETGVPIVRPLVFDFQGDENTWSISDEYMFCDKYLVAPVLERSESRRIYLPKGVWIDVGTGVRHDVPIDGKWILRKVPEGDVAVFRALRPPEEVRTFRSEAVDAKIASVAAKIKNKTVRDMFEACYPNTLDTTVKGDGYVITGDIDAMWLRDSAAQVWPYLRHVGEDARLKELVRKLILRQFANLRLDPYANAFYADGKKVGEWKDDMTDMKPGLHERKYEIDSLCYPIRLAYGYWKASGDATVFSGEWENTLRIVLRTFREQQRKGGQETSYRFQRLTKTPVDTLGNSGRGNPVRPVGLIASAFRPSDDATILPFLVPSNFFAVDVLRKSLEILKATGGSAALAKECDALADEVHEALMKHAVVDTEKWGRVYAFEVDGYGGHILMDDANAPSLLSLPYLCGIDRHDPVYMNTRRMILSPEGNPYCFRGKALEGIGSPHTGLGKVWPMSLIMRILTSEDDDEIRAAMKMLVDTTAGTGFMHESVNADDPADFTRSWFAWANTLFGEVVLELVERGKADLL